MSQTAGDKAATAKARAAVMRSQLGRARGVGVTGAPAVEHWRVERITAIALVPLTIWFVIAVISLLGQPQHVVAHWVSHPVNAALLLALITMTFHHTQLGLQVVIGDYIQSKPMELIATLANKGLALILALLAIVAVLKMTL
jgi:succinate dehydrogenase / fumarate reductase membrane anchor subunit